MENSARGELVERCEPYASAVIHVFSFGCGFAALRLGANYSEKD